MSMFDAASDRVGKIASDAFGEIAPVLGKESASLLKGASSKIVDSMKSLPSAKDLGNLGFPGIEDIFQQGDILTINIKGDVSKGIGGIFEQVQDLFGKKSPLGDIFGTSESPIDRLLGGKGGFSDALSVAKDLFSGSPDKLLGSGGLGDVFSGLKGILGASNGGLGGILGGLQGLLGGANGGLFGIIGQILPAISSLLPLIMQAAPLAAAIL